MNKRISRLTSIVISCSLIWQMTGCSSVKLPSSEDEDSASDNSASVSSSAEPVSDASSDSTASASEDTSAAPEVSVETTNVTRPSLLSGLFSAADIKSVEPTASDITMKPESDLSNIINLDQFYLNDYQIELLAENGFMVSAYDGESEFFTEYEYNRYAQIPNFVTVDSMMHTYHLYFSYLLKNTEKNYLSDKLQTLGSDLLDNSKEQYESLKGTEWENAAAMNVAYFAIGSSLLDSSTEVPDYVQKVVKSELSLINNAAGITESPLFGSFNKNGDPIMEDYSQYKPRGYYAGDEELEAYFRSMMWYGRINFDARDEEQMKSAILMNLAMSGDPAKVWEEIYQVTSFFAGESDDLSYYEFMPAIQTAFAADTDLTAIIDDKDGFSTFMSLVSEMRGPVINSVPTMDHEDGADKAAENKGFRFMGQRFSVDGAIFQKLVYNEVTENSDGDKRMLPDALDVPAALGSKEATNLLDEQGETSYGKYSDNLKALQADLSAAPDSFWEGSLATSWIRTMMPLLSDKDGNYPYFMTTAAWADRSLEGFLGSWTELKHDTVLYGKQKMAEMGGDDYEQKDDRGYVEPEPQVFSGLAALVTRTSDGLDGFGIISEDDKENLSKLTELATSLATIAEKELTGGDVTDDEYELIRSYGGSIEHFWLDTVKTDDNSSPYPEEFPCSLVTDVASDPNGQVLECGTSCSSITVIVPIDGQLRLARGSVFSFYEFSWPLQNRLTDQQWREGMGYEPKVNSDGSYEYQEKAMDVEKPWWTLGYRNKNEY